MDKKQFTQQVVKLGAGILSNVAQLAINEDRIEEHIQMWLEQDADPNSSKTVQRTLGPELYTVLLTFKS